MYSEILSRIRTVEEAEKLIEEIEILLKSLYEAQGAGLDSALKGRVRQWVAEAMRKDWSENDSDKETYLKKLKETLSGFKTLNLTIAFEPTDVNLEKIYKIAKTNIGESILLNITYDSKILGGILVDYKGEYRDFSLNRLFDQEFDTRKNEILDLIRKQK